MSEIGVLAGKVKRSLQKDGVAGLARTTVFYLKKRWEKLTQKHDYLVPRETYDNKGNLVKKDGPVIHIVAGIPYYDIGGGQRCSQLAKTLNKMGYRVRYLYGYPSADKMNKSIAIPCETHAHINKASIEYVASQLKKEDVFIFEAPFAPFAPLLDLAVSRQCHIIYENIDNWETSLGSSFFDPDLLKKLLIHARVLVGTAKPLVQQLENCLNQFEIDAEEKQILYLPNAVDEDLFCGARIYDAPEDLVKGSCTLMYYGSLWGEWFCWDMLKELASRHPDYAINLIGNADGIPQIVSECPKNIHFLGLKPQHLLPGYLQHVDYAILPFARGEIGDYVSPLKIFEYISMYARVLSTSLPDIAGYPNVYVGDTVAEWEAVIAQDPQVDQAEADRFAESNSWTQRASTMLQVTCEQNREFSLKGKLAIVVLNYNNKRIIFKCINSLLRYRPQYDYEIIVVDNGSTDGSYEMLQQQYSPKEVTVIRNARNGCSSGRNLGVAQTEREYILFLDSDQWAISPYWLRAYENAMERAESWGAIGWGAGFFDRAGRSSRTVDEFRLRYMPVQYLCRSDIGYLATDGVLMRREDFLAVDGFDEAYDPTCYEDTDLALKMRHYGKELYYCPYLGVIHLPHQTTKAGSGAHTTLTNQKYEYFVKKWKEKNPKLLEYIK